MGQLVDIALAALAVTALFANPAIAQPMTFGDVRGDCAHINDDGALDPLNKRTNAHSSSPSQLADKSKATAKEKAALKLWDTRLLECNRPTAAWIKAQGYAQPLVDNAANWWETSRQLRIGLIQGELAWGEFNQRRRDAWLIFAEHDRRITAELKEAYQRAESEQQEKVRLEAARQQELQRLAAEREAMAAQAAERQRQLDQQQAMLEAQRSAAIMQAGAALLSRPALVAPPMMQPFPRSTQCTSSRMGLSVQTTCY